jgi:hypothetical protein
MAQQHEAHCGLLSAGQNLWQNGERLGSRRKVTQRRHDKANYLEYGKAEIARRSRGKEISGMRRKLRRESLTDPRQLGLHAAE